MSKYKVGDKVLLDGEVVKINNDNEDYPYFIKTANVQLIFAESEIISKTYEDGLADAWGFARKIENKLGSTILESVFGSSRIADILDNFTIQEALAKVEAYEKSQQIQQIQVGDEIAVVGNAIKGYVIDDYKEGEDCCVVLITNYRELHTTIYHRKDLKKTGRHIDIEHLLEQIRGD